MTRDDEIIQEALSRYRGSVLEGSQYSGFIIGARWADAHPQNPWRDAMKELPPRDVALVFPTHSIPVIGMIGNSTDIIHTGMRYDYSSKEWCYGFTPMRKYGADKDDLLISGDTLPVTHWMPIPETPKGKEG